jgi:recombination protein RecA
VAIRRKSSSEELRFEDEPPVTHYLSTGCTILDLAIADRYPGGFGAGRISHIVGPESSAKSVLVAEPLGSAQRQGGKAYMVDAENTFDFGRAGLFGLDGKKLIYYGTEDDLTIESLFDGILPEVMGDCSNSGPNAIGIDSLSSITSDVESEEKLDQGTYGTSRPKALSKAFRRDLRKFSKANLGLIFIDQTRQNIQATGWGKNYTFSGGEALKFYASTRLYVKKEANILNKHKKVVGVEIGFKVEKNKIAPPFRDGCFSLIFDYGIDDIRTNILWLKENSAFDNYGPKSRGFMLPGVDKSFQSLSKAIDYVEQEGMERELVDFVVEYWHFVYSKTERKRRVR